jgi:type I restriction enzyme S subunit
VKSLFQIRVLGECIDQVSVRSKGRTNAKVFSVTNSEGFKLSTEYFSKEVFSKDTSNYKVVERGEFAYNPSRINVGSIDYLRIADSALVSPLYVVFKPKKKILSGYLLRFLPEWKSDWGNLQIRANTEGAVRDSLKYKGLEKIRTKIPLPPLEDQKSFSFRQTR